MPKFSVGDIVVLNNLYPNQYLQFSQATVLMVIARQNNPNNYPLVTSFYYDIEINHMNGPASNRQVNDIHEDFLDLVFPKSITLAKALTAAGISSSALARNGFYPVSSPLNIPNSYKIGDIVEYINPDSITLKAGTLFEVIECCDDSITMVGKDCYTGKEYSFLKDCVKLSTARPINTPVPKLHLHLWKNYQGLSYQEEYCDCGVTKNRRGLFE